MQCIMTECILTLIKYMVFKVLVMRQETDRDKKRPDYDWLELYIKQQSRKWQDSAL